jgi:hypothetical protein
LLDVVDPGIKNTFGDDNGVQAFSRIWELDRADSALWGELRRVLTLGGTFEGPDTFVAPYVFSNWPSEFDAFDHVALVGDAPRVLQPIERPLVDGRPLLGTISAREMLCFAIHHAGHHVAATTARLPRPSGGVV